MVEPKPPSRRNWLLFLPFAVLVVLAVAWSGFWYFAASRTEAIVSTWIEQEASAGRVYACASRTIGGYPFRIELRCSQPVMELTSLQPPRVVKARDLVALAQVYQPGVIIAEITGPVAIGDSGSPPILQADWRLAQASLRAAGRRPERLSVVLESVRLEQVDSGSPETMSRADRVEMHIRRSPADSGENAPIDFAGVLAGGVIAAGPLGGRPINAETSGILRGLAEFKRQPMSARLREWQMAGGRLELTRLRVQQGDAVAVAAGDVGLSASGRPDGTINITMAGFDQVVRDLVRGGGMQLGVIAGLTFLGRPAEIDGRRAVSVPFRIKDGSMSLGPIPLGKLDPLF
jgi:hypothetical protein